MTPKDFGLTPTEQAVLGWWLAGKSRAAIAEHRGWATRKETSRYFVSARKKLGMRGRSDGALACVALVIGIRPMDFDGQVAHPRPFLADLSR